MVRNFIRKSRFQLTVISLTIKSQMLNSLHICRSMKVTGSLFLLIFLSPISYAQNQLPTADSQKDLEIIRDISIGTVPLLSEEMKVAIEKKIQ